MNAHAPVQIGNDPWDFWWRLGYRWLTPIMPPECQLSPTCSIFKKIAKGGKDDRGKAPGIRLNNGFWVGHDFTTCRPTLRQTEAWRDMGASIGIVLGEGLVAIDADCLEGEYADVCSAEIESRIGLLPCRVGKAPKRLYLCRTAPNYEYRCVLFGPRNEKGLQDNRVEILSTNRQFVAWGLHPGTMRPYEWVSGPLPLESVPYVEPEVLDALMDALKAQLPHAEPVEIGLARRDVDQASLKAEKLEVALAAAEALPNTSALFPRRNDYIRVGAAFKAMFADWPDEGFEAWCGWGDKYEAGTNDRETMESDWRRIKAPFDIGAPWVYSKADKHSGGKFTLAQAFHEEITAPPAAPVKPPALFGTPYDFAPAASIAPREFLYGYHYLRKYVSATIAPTKVGKSSLGVVEALAMASGKPLLGVRPTGLWRVRIWNGEDPRDEMARRICAAMIEYGLTSADIGDRLLVDSGRDMPICIAKPVSGTTVVAAPVVGALEAALRAQQVDVLIIDPFVKSHGVSENDNMAVDQVAREWNMVAGRCGVAVDLVHHSRKLNGGEASIDDARGASALVSAARSARVLARMTKTEGRRLSDPKQYRRFFRFADAASNMAISAGEDEKWMEMKSVDLNNAVFGEDGVLKWPSDQVGVVRLSTGVREPEEVDSGEEFAEAEQEALAGLASGDWKADMQARGSWAGAVIAQAYGLDLDDPEQKARVKSIIKNLVDKKKLIVELRRDPVARRDKMYVRTAIQPVITDSSDLFG